ncbi:LysR family transcriptional regulator [Corynebacterium diphtheriae]
MANVKTLVEPAALALLIAVDEYGSVSAAADIVGTSQANASRSLSRAEHRLGAQLLDRGPQGTTLTAAGQIVIQHARTIICGYHDLEAASRNLGDSPVGLRIAASNTIADHLLPHWLHVWDGSVLALTTTNSSEVVAGLHRRQWDLGFIEAPEFSAGIHHSVVAHDELIVVCTPDHPMTQLDHVTITDLSTTALITREKGSGTRICLERALGQPPLIKLEVSSNAAVRSAVLSGSAPAVLSHTVVKDDLAAGSLKRIPTEGIDLTRPLTAVWSGPRALPPAAAQLVAVARELSCTESSL